MHSILYIHIYIYIRVHMHMGLLFLIDSIHHN